MTVALITGAASGIGAATVARLASDGVADFILVDRDADGLATVAGEIAGKVLRRVHDVADEHGWAETEALAKAKFGRVDMAVVNAGVSGAGTITEMPFDEWRRILSVNLDGAFLTIRAALRLMAGGPGSAVVVSSASGIKADAGIAAYGASKAAVLQLMKVAAKEAAPQGIRVNAILPGGVETPIWRGMAFFDALVEERGSEQAAFDAMAKMATPLGHYAKASEIAGLIALLLSPATSSMTGAALSVDGGYTL